MRMYRGVRRRKMSVHYQISGSLEHLTDVMAPATVRSALRKVVESDELWELYQAKHDATELLEKDVCRSERLVAKVLGGTK